MKTVICYYSRHHGNTLKVAEAMAEAGGAELFDVTSRMAFYPEQYDMIGFASPVNAWKLHPAVTAFARQYLPEGANTFFVCTAGGKPSSKYLKELRETAVEKHARVLGEFLCRGFCTFGPFGLVGGVAKGHPDSAELAEAKEFFKKVIEKAEERS